jgi:hypothetical protein
MLYQKWTIQRNWQHRVHKTKKNKDKEKQSNNIICWTPLYVNKQHNNICWTPLYVNKHNNVNKTWALLQTTGGKDEPNIVFMRKWSRKSQHGIQNVKTHNRTTQVKIRSTSFRHTYVTFFRFWPPSLGHLV